MRKDDTPAALYLHCVNTYEGMLRDAKSVKNTRTGEDEIIWEGMLVNFITSKMNLSVPYYTTITRALKRMGCVEQLKRGGGTAPSQWRLLEAPTLSAYESATPRKTSARSIDKYEVLQQQLNVLSRRVLSLETILENIIQEEEKKHVVRREQL